MQTTPYVRHAMLLLAAVCLSLSTLATRAAAPVEEAAQGGPAAATADAEASDTGEASEEPQAEPAADQPMAELPASDEVIGLFEAQETGAVEVKFIAKNDHEGRLLVTNKLPHDLRVQMPDAFVGVPALAQFGGRGGGGGLGGGGGGRGGGFGGGGGGNQAVGGGMGGMGGGMGGMGGGMFSIPPEKLTKIDVPLVCIEHGKSQPSASKAYEIRPAESYVDRPEVIELLKAFGRGELQHNAAQAAVWHLNSDMTWAELASKLTGTARNINRSPYFNQFELQAAYAYSAEAIRRAATNDTSESEQHYGE